MLWHKHYGKQDLSGQICEVTLGHLKFLSKNNTSIQFFVQTVTLDENLCQKSDIRNKISVFFVTFDNKKSEIALDFGIAKRCLALLAFIKTLIIFTNLTPDKTEKLW